jgi:glucosylceramidase
MYICTLFLFSGIIFCQTLVPYLSNQNGSKLEKGASITFGNTDGSSLIELFPDKELQEIWGIGSALTEAAASNFVALSQDQQDKLAELYFDAEKGIGATMARTHINSADFSISEYVYTTDEDPNLGTFNIDRERKFSLD